MRDESLYPFFADLVSLPGIGPKTAPLVERLVGGDKVIDLLLHLPTHWIDRRARSSIVEAPVDEISTVTGAVHSINAGHGSAPTKIRIADDSGFLTLVYFRAQPNWLRRAFPMNEHVAVSGMVEDYNGELQMTHPDHVIRTDTGEMPPEVEPVYRMTAGVTGRLLQKAIGGALETVTELPEWIDKHLALKNNWLAFVSALQQLHRPQEFSPDDFKRARARIAYDEALAREIAIAQARLVREREDAVAIPPSPHLTEDLLSNLSFIPTGAQLRAYDDIRSDISRKIPMRRLVQGDVGAGKTLVAALAIAQAAASDMVTAFMSPTEVLARQQADALNRFLEPIGFKCAALTGRDSAASKRKILEDVNKGRVHVLSGTQALYQESVNVERLGLVVIDEQHRFGVADRLKLTSKGDAPHLLMMSATPIPRTLSLALNGDLDTSILDEKPANRKPVTTRVAPDTRVDEVMNAVSRAVDRGERAFWICPAVDSENAEDAAATVRRDVLAKHVSKPVTLVHGKLPAVDKDAALNAFRNGEASVLVATTVVEVGVDVPEATIMVIERADNFGLAQLHQLRGRVGRGDKASSCLLLYKPPLTESGKNRLEVLRETDDGFEIAEADFKLRGPGDLLGLRQSGLPAFKVLDLTQDANLLETARNDARNLVAQDEHFTGERGMAARLVRDLFAPRVKVET